MLWVRRLVYNIIRLIRVFIICGYWFFLKEWIIFYVVYVSVKKSSRGIGKVDLGIERVEGKRIEL